MAPDLHITDSVYLTLAYSFLCFCNLLLHLHGIALTTYDYDLSFFSWEALHCSHFYHFFVSSPASGT